MGLRVSVVICAYTEARWDDLVAAVGSVHCQIQPPHETIVVIDHNPALLERVQREVPGVLAMANTEAQGLSGARNTGVGAATGDVIAFLDDDAVAEPDWLAWIKPVYASSAVIGVGGAIEPAWEHGRPGWFPREFDWVVGCTYEGMPTSLAETRNLIGANMSLRREVFDRIGGFVHGMGRTGTGMDSTLPFGCEETELCIRARQNAREGRIMYEPAARVRHRVPASRATWRYFRSRCYAEGISKAQVSRLVGAGAGTSTERRYTLYTLPSGIAHGLRDLLRGDAAGLGRAAAIVGGFVLTLAGYLVGTLKSRPVRGSSA